MRPIILVGSCSDIAQETIKKVGSQHHLILLTRDKSKLPTEVSEKYECHSCDPCNHEQTSEVFKMISINHTIASVVNFCGSIMLKSASALSESDWNKTIQINLTTAFNVAHATTKHIKENCSLIHFSSAAAQLGLPNHEAIAAAKAGVEGLSKSIAASYASKNIRSNVISLGLIKTKLSQSITKSTQGNALSLSMHALNRLGKPSDAAWAIAWLLNPENDWITGEVIHIDGGLSATKNYQKK